MVEIRRLTRENAPQYKTALAEVLLDCVSGGASVSFVWPFSLADAESFFGKVIQGVEAGDRILLAAFIGASLVGTVQILLNTPPNQPHRADVSKLLVHRSARKQGVAQKLMQEVEEASRLAGKTLLVLDTVTGESGERLYQRLGWTKVGIIPNYAVFPDGTYCDTTIFWKSILREPIGGV